MLCVLRYQGTSLGEATVSDGHQEHEDDPPSLERAVLPPTPSGTTAKGPQAALPPNIRSITAQPDKLLNSSGAGPAPPPTPSGTTAEVVLPPKGPVLPPCLHAAYPGRGPCTHFAPLLPL